MQSPQGLYYLNTKDSGVAGFMTLLNIDDRYSIQYIPYIGTVFLSLIEDNRFVYTRRSYLKAQLERKVNRIIERPSTKDYKRYVAKNDMISCPISLADVKADGDILVNMSVTCAARQNDPRPIKYRPYKSRCPSTSWIGTNPSYYQLISCSYTV